MRLFKFSNNKKSDLLKVYSHPRSGTHFLEAFLANNFYQNINLSIKEIEWGHWSNRKVNPRGNPYGRLFGHHYLPNNSNFNSRGLYIIRDGRAVAYSIWKTDNFLNKSINKKISFSEFLKMPLDWQGSPSRKSKHNLNIFEHWHNHCSKWLQFSKLQKNLKIIFYEDLKNKPYEVYNEIKKFEFKDNPKLNYEDIDIIPKPIGLLPNDGNNSAWQDHFTNYDLNNFYSSLQNIILKERYGI